MSGVYTIAHTLADAKTSALSDLATAFESYTSTDYTTANRATLTGYNAA